jgi:protein-S-isoprenylcysteine O-methyltransferase Ste14
MNDTTAPFRQHYRINALRALAASALCILTVTAPPPSLPIANWFLDLFGALAIFIGIAGRGWTLIYIGGRKNAELVTFGPYSISRNPLYLFSLIGISGVAAETGSVIVMAICVGTSYLAFAMAMRGEEAFLARRYAGVFDDYRMSVPRLWPDLSLWQECQDLPLRSANAVASLKDGAVFIVAWIAVDLVPALQSTGLLPIVWTLPI